MKVTICIGSSCHVKGSHAVIEVLRRRLAEEKLEDDVELAGTFCMGKCQEGVCVTVDDAFHSVSPEQAETFFDEHILPAFRH